MAGGFARLHSLAAKGSPAAAPASSHSMKVSRRLPDRRQDFAAVLQAV